MLKKELSRRFQLMYGKYVELWGFQASAGIGDLHYFPQTSAELAA
jgi:hypothetical protein